MVEGRQYLRKLAVRTWSKLCCDAYDVSIFRRQSTRQVYTYHSKNRLVYISAPFMLRRYRGEAIWPKLHVAQNVLLLDMCSSTLNALFSIFERDIPENKRHYIHCCAASCEAVIRNKDDPNGGSLRSELQRVGVLCHYTRYDHGTIRKSVPFCCAYILLPLSLN